MNHAATEAVSAGGMPGSPSSKTLKSLQKDIMKEMKKEDKTVKKAMADLHNSEKAVERADKSAQKLASKVRKMDSKEIQAQKNVNKQNELYRTAMNQHDKTKTEKEELEKHFNNDMQHAHQLKEELQMKRSKLDEMIQAQQTHNEERHNNLAQIKGGFLPGHEGSGHGASAAGSTGPRAEAPTSGHQATAEAPASGNQAHTGASNTEPQAAIGAPIPGHGSQGHAEAPGPGNQPRTGGSNVATAAVGAGGPQMPVSDASPHVPSSGAQSQQVKGANHVAGAQTQVGPQGFIPAPGRVDPGTPGSAGFGAPGAGTGEAEVEHKVPGMA